MAEQSARNKRSAAASILTESIRELLRYRAKDNLSKRLLEQKLNNVTTAKEALMITHHNYAEKANRDLNSEEECEYIRPRLDECHDVIDDIELILENLEVKEKENQLTKEAAASSTQLEKKRADEYTIAEMQAEIDVEILTDSVNRMIQTVGDAGNANEDGAVLVENLLKEMESLLEQAIKSWNRMKSLTAEEEKLKAVFQMENQIKKLVFQRHSLGVAFIKKHSARPLLKSEVDETSVIGEEAKVRLEKMKLPTFGGDIRSFARFKADFKAIVVPGYTNMIHQTYVLKENCLLGEAKKLVENIDNIETIWSRLQEKYGDNIEIVNAIIKDIEKVSFPKYNQDSGLVTLVDTLEKGIQDLTAINARHEIANAYTVKLLEMKLPKRVLAKWLEREEGADGPSRFEKLLEFLKQERKQTERLIQLKEQAEKDSPPFNKDTRKLKSAHAAAGTPISSENMKSKHNNSCLIHKDSSHLTRKCRIFLEKTVQERGQIVKDTNGCKLCLSLSHAGKPCPFELEWGTCNIRGCTEHHSRLVHGCAIQGISMFLQSCNKVEEGAAEETKTLLLIHEVKCTVGEITCFWDNGSTLALVAKEFVDRKQLKGVPVSYDLITVGGHTTTQNTMMHEITLVDRSGEKHVIKAYQIDDICGEVKALKIKGLMYLFPLTRLQDVKRCDGKIELLIGMDYAKLHPKPLCEREGVILYGSQFGTGKLLGGSHKKIEGSSEIQSYPKSAAHAQVQNVRINRSTNIGVDFFTAEDLGVKIPSRCNRCKECKDCRFETHQLTRVEQKELEVMRTNLQLDPILNQWVTRYPYKCNPNVLSNNKAQALAMLQRTEKRLSRNMIAADQYCEQFKDFISRGIFTEITEKEEKEYDGPIFYISHHEVYKEGSSSTPIRLVINSSLKYNGLSLNDILMKGPNSLNSLFGIQLRFRTYIYALVGDVRKMYHSIHTTELEKHLRRVLWRDMQRGETPKSYGIERVTFGDKPAAAISSIAMRETAEIYKHISEEAAEKIQNDVYVDDITTGDHSKEKINEHKENIVKILEKGGFFMKGFVTSGDESEESRLLLGTGEKGRVLGICWDPTLDEFTVQTRVNLSKKYKGARTAPDLKYEEVPQLIEMTLTRRILLGIVNSCYDPLGLLAPITIQMKIELRTLYNKEMNLSWDDPVPSHVKKNWIRILQLVKESEEVRFPRCIKPTDAIGNPDLIMSNDGSSEAMCTTAHVRWKLKSGSYACYLWSAKTRVAPLQKNSIPRIEMQSAVISTRLSKSIKMFSGIEFKQVIHILDSKCTLATLSKDTMVLREFMGNRVSEILETTTVDQWYHVKSSNNIADLGTRKNATIKDISDESDWQRGPPWMKLEKDDWPVSQDIGDTSVPEDELLKAVTASFAVIKTDMFTLERFRCKSYIFLLRVMATTIKILKGKSFKIDKIKAEDIDEAEKLCIKLSMRLTREDLKAGKLNSLRPKVDEDETVIIACRALEGLKSYYDQEKFPILTYRDPLSELWMKKVHNEDHSGVTKTVAKSRRKYWIMRGRKLAQKIKRSCYRCRLVDKRLAQQQMAPLPSTRLAPSPPFHTTSLDLFGPIEIKDTVKQRNRKKVWGVIFNCTVTRALYIDVSEDYSTDAILQVIRRFISIRGCPSEIQSDQGSQLIAAAKDIAELCKKWEWKQIHDWAANNQIKWTLAPAEGQHQNGLSESLIKSIKRSLEHKICGHTLSFSELQMTLFEIANIINSRPLGIITGSDPEQPQPITPNHLLLGRASSDTPQGPFDTKKSITKRFRFLQNFVDQWWDSWYQTVLPSLVPSYKWLQRHRNVEVGDVCLIRYGKDKRATYRLGRVKEVKKGVDGLVRTVVLNYKLPAEKVYRTVDRPIHGIAVIVPVEEQKGRDTVTDGYVNESNKVDLDAACCSHQSDRDASNTLNPGAPDFYPGRRPTE